MDIIRSNVSIEVVERVEYVGSDTPAQLIKMWGGELKTDSAKSNKDLTCAGSDMSALKADADKERGGVSWEILRSDIISFAPREAKWMAIAWPMPPKPPVTIATRSLSWKDGDWVASDGEVVVVAACTSS